MGRGTVAKRTLSTAQNSPTTQNGGGLPTVFGGFQNECVLQSTNRQLLTGPRLWPPFASVLIRHSRRSGRQTPKLLTEPLHIDTLSDPGTKVYIRNSAPERHDAISAQKTLRLSMGDIARRGDIRFQVRKDYLDGLHAQRRLGGCSWWTRCAATVRSTRAAVGRKWISQPPVILPSATPTSEVRDVGSASIFILSAARPSPQEARLWAGIGAPVITAPYTADHNARSKPRVLAPVWLQTPRPRKLQPPQLGPTVSPPSRERLQAGAPMIRKRDLMPGRGVGGGAIASDPVGSSRPPGAAKPGRPNSGQTGSTGGRQAIL